MATDFPGVGLDTFTPNRVIDLEDALKAVETKLGVNGSADAASVDYKVARSVRTSERPRSPMQASYGGAFTAANVMAALAGGAAVDLPPGTCVGSIAVPGGATLTGIPGKTILKAAAGAATNILTNADTGGFTVEGVTFDGSKSTVTSGGSTVGNGMYLTNCGGVTVRRSRFINTRHSGIQTVDVDDLVVVDNDFDDCGDPAQDGTFRTNGITFRGMRNVITDNRVRRASCIAICPGVTATGQANGFVINDNKLYQPGQFGVALGSYVSGFDVSGNYIDGGINCIDTGTATDGKVSDNTCINAVADGIDADLASLVLTKAEVGLMISDNRVRNCGRYGIIVGLPSAASGVSVTGNQIDTCDLHGIALINVWRSVIQGNTIRNFNMNAGSFFCAITFFGNSKHNMVIGNVAFEDRATKRGVGYGEQGGGSYDYQTLIGNDFFDTAVPYNLGTPSAGPNPGDIRVGNR